MPVYSKEENEMEGRRASFGLRQPSSVENAFLRLLEPDFVTFAVKEAKKGRLGESFRLRSVCWKLFLGVIDKTSGLEGWIKSLEEKRAEYAALKAEYLYDPTEADGDPLSADSSWGEYHENVELRGEIQKDMERLYPEGLDTFFEDEELRALMVNVLFTWSKRHPDTSYRQGMHELLAPIVYILEEEKIAPVPGNLVSELCSAAHVEADAFWIFEQLMHDMEPLFASHSPGEKSPMLAVCDRIQVERMMLADAALSKHLQAIELQPQLYAMRWIRLLFAREFHHSDVLVLWDGMFAMHCERNCSILTICEWIACGMLIYVREQLLAGDFTKCAKRLMSYPPVEDVNTFLEAAVRLEEGKQLKTAKDVPPATEEQSVRDAVIAFYQRVNPEKVEDVPRILLKYKGKEQLLLKHLQLKYGMNIPIAGEMSTATAQVVVAPEKTAKKRVAASMSKMGRALKQKAVAVGHKLRSPHSPQVPSRPSDSLVLLRAAIQQLQEFVPAELDDESSIVCLAVDVRSVIADLKKAASKMN